MESMSILRFILKKETGEKIIQVKELDQGLGKVADLGEAEEEEVVEEVDLGEEEVEEEGEGEEGDSNSNNGKNKITKNS